MDTCLAQHSLEETSVHPVLIVDDNPVVVRTLEAMLTRAGYPVVSAASGDMALVLLETTCPVLILLDIEMPGLSGLETCRIIKENPRTAAIPILFVTASTDKHDIVAGFLAGAQDYIIKPSSKEELLARARTHIALYKTQQALKASEIRYRELSYLDDLTGFYNTRYLYQTLQASLEAHPLQSVAAVFIDIDTFKSVVDTYGHLNGSRTIAEVAAVIRPLLPGGGYGVSYGGDEFVLILTDHDGSAGVMLADRIRRAIESHPFLTSQGHAVGLTISCGVAAYPDDAQNMVDLLGNADHALFASKKQGRNAVVAFADMTETWPDA
ncbi:diguanylate cyclase [Desulfobulbus alkaliphilus]|uniref:diguanylate cyclase n=1 Tax=Desulfobulbus alkaliphilus TaxID=869814 RepID=UPI001962F056|nr:diguanylate cyclase [Desulfobulbus alkaliphilus]MBM9535712.1 diguanylate cyclase [Desulfobulbus alkaliphilus]